MENVISFFLIIRWWKFFIVFSKYLSTCYGFVFQLIFAPKYLYYTRFYNYPKIINNLLFTVILPW